MYNQRNSEQLYESIGSVEGYSFERHPNFDVIKSDSTSWPNAILNVRGSRSELEILLDQIEAPATFKSAFPKLIKCCPNSDNSDLLNLSKERNYRTGSWTAMTHNLHELVTLEATQLSIQQVTSQNEIKLWATIVATELMNDPEMDATLFESMINMETCYFYLGWVGDKAIAASMLFVKDGVGGIYLVATDKKHRKRGFGAEVTNICLHKAKELQCSRVDIQATDAGKNMYGALGFKDSGRINVVVVD